VGQLLTARKLTLATAESCTGGGIGFWLTSVAGSSSWYEGGIIAYSNAIKIKLLGVDEATLAQQGAVSKETAIAMAEGARKVCGTDIAIATTGIAGPGGGSLEKPVGTVWFAWAYADLQPVAKCICLTGSRASIREQAIQIALEALVVLNKA